ncbi:MAG: DUF1559 domain-containing protein, partial [Planctomycetia bacterium]|nr:DUF1559 domain-containing protein [Planctomycetia bacterium]
MRDYLIGYLLDALEPTEHEMVAAQLNHDPQLKRELELIARSLQPLGADREPFDPPPGLAERTCQFVAVRAQATLAPPAAAFFPGRWTLTDLVIAAGIFFAATMLFFPALSQSRFASQVTSCQNNLRQIGIGLTSYSELHNKYFPDIPREASLGAAGIYATRLFDQGLLNGPHLVICPASALAERSAEFRIPTLKELQTAQGAELARLQRRMGGSYGYNIGYISQGRYQATRNLRRPRFALMADAPNAEPPYHSINHQGCGQNVLF